MPIESSSVNRLFIFRFKGVSFDTDEGAGQDTSLANLLNEKYGNVKVEVNAEHENDALEMAIDHLSNISGYCVLDADYDMQVS